MSDEGSNRLVTLDALRGVAAWLVLLSHVGFWTGATATGTVGGLIARGDAGVAVFFALSALLLSSPLVRLALDPEHAGRWDTARYWVRRAARILPAYLLALAAVLLTALWIGGRAADPLDGGTIAAHLVIGQGITGRTFVSFTQTWSLTTEVTFYVLLPAAAWVAGRWVLATPDRVRRGRRMLLVVAGVAVAGLVTQGVAAQFTGPWSPWWAGALATSALGHGAWFAVGLALAVMVEAERVGLVLLPRRLRVAWEMLRTSPGIVLAAAAVCWLIASTPLAGPRDLADPTVAAVMGKEILYTAAAACLLLAAVARGVPEAVAGGPLAPVARFLGATSYGVFLWHVLVLQVLFHLGGLPLFEAPFAPTLLAVTLTSLVIAHLSWTLVERPILRWAHRRAPRPAPTPAPRP